MQSYKETLTDGDLWNVCYIIDAPWAHPLWSQYILAGYSLDAKSVRYRGDVTHEVMLHAIDPDHKILHSPLKEQRLKFLQPANVGYQLTTTNDKLVEILDDVVDRIDHKTMSPDTDFRWQWDITFITKHGGVTLLRSIFDQTSTLKH